MGARFVLLACMMVACDALPPAQDGVCGNRVIDPSEDCDTFASAPGAVCRAPGATGQCRYACGTQTDGTTATCPPGMGCGTDGTCRKPSGTFAETTQLVEGTFSDVYAGDVDGDGRSDIVGLQANVISTSFFDSTLTAHTTMDIVRRANVDVHPLVRDLSGDGRSDLVVVSGNGTVVELGRADRSFAPLAFPSTYIAKLADAQVIVFDAAPPYRGDTLLVMGTYGNISGIAALDPVTGQGAGFALMSSPPSDLAGALVVGHLIEDATISPCGELAFAYVGGSEVDVFTTCVSDGKGGYKYNDYINTSTPLKLALQNGATVVSGPLLVDANADGHLDFLVGATRCTGCDEIDVAYGAGDGTFTTFAPYPLTLVPNAKQGPLPLAMGDMNGDGILDHVTTSKVLVSEKVGNAIDFVTQAQGHGAPWTQAVIADFNRDDIPDVAAGSVAAPNVDFYLGAGGGVLDVFSIPSAPTNHFVVGDFDGDLVKDLALAEVAPSDDPLGDSVSILFGKSAGAPNTPISMGRFPSLMQTTVGRFTDPFGVLGGTDLLLTTAQVTGATEFGSFAGSGDRVLRSPLQMNVLDTTTQTATSAYPLRYAFGRFTSQSGPAQLAAIDDQFFPLPPPAVHHPWLMPLDAQGRFDMTVRRHGDALPDGIDWYSSALVAVDLDGSGADQLVAFGPSEANPTTQGVVAVAHVVPGPSSDPTPLLSFGAPSNLPVLVTHVESKDPSSQSGRVVATDLDGDARPDIVAVATVSGTTNVVVMWNDLGGSVGTPTVVPSPNGHATIDFVVIDAGGASPSLAVLTDEGVSLVSFAQRTPTVQPLAFAVTTGTRIASGDVDGDGVADLAVATNAGIAIYRARAVRP